MPKRIQRKRVKGWRMPEGAVYVGRGTKWGNPYRVGTCLIADRQAATQAFAGNLPLGKIDGIDELRDKDLACWCPIPKPGEVDWCHAAVLIIEANK